MRLYRYRALDATGLPFSGQMLATDVVDIEAQLAERGSELLAIRRLPAGRGLHTSRSELIEFCVHLEHLLDAGIPLLDALRDLERAASRPLFQATVAALADMVDRGTPLSGAMRALPGCFDALLIGVVAAGEESGRLPEVLRQTGAALQRIDALHARTARQLIYPALAGSVALGAALFLLYFLVPQIRGFLLDSGRPLPYATQLLFSLSANLETWGLPLLVVLPSVGFGLGFAIHRHPPWQERLDAWKLALPILGTIHLKAGLARLGDLLGLLYACGIPLLQALDTVAPTAGNRRLEAALHRARQRLETGTPLTEAFASDPIFPPLLLRMLQVGESTGRLDAALAHLARRYQHDASEASARLQTLIEPTLTLCIGLFLGWIMLATLQPIYDIVGTLR